MHIKSRRFGDVKGWKPYRGKDVCDRGKTTLTKPIIVVNSISSATDRQYTHVILSTKCIPDVIKTPDLLKPLLSSPYCDKFEQPTYVLLQNGLNIEVDLYHAIKDLGNPIEPRIINTGVYVFANLIAPNVVEHGPFVGLNILNHTLFLIHFRCPGTTRCRYLPTQ